MIYAKRAPSRKRTIYSNRTHRNDYDFSIENDRIVARERHGAGLWTDLEVKTGALKYLIRKLRKQHAVTDQPDGPEPNPSLPVGRWNQAEFIKRSTPAEPEFSNPPFPFNPAGMPGSMGFNEAILNEPMRNDAVERMEATLTVTPSQDNVTAFEEMRERVKVLEDLIAWMPPQDRHGIGGNFPPEPIEDAPLTGAEWSELRQLVVVLRSQTALPEQKPVEAIEAKSRLKAIADKILSFLGRCADDYRSGFFTQLGKRSADAVAVTAVLLCGHSTLSHLADVLMSSSDAVQAWLHTLGY